MKGIIFSTVLATTLLACNGTQQGQAEQNGLRSDGYYQSEKGKITYMARFYAEGTVILVGGLADGHAQMLRLLTPEGPKLNNNVHNVPYTLYENDSVFFSTTSNKGTIEYSGLSHHPDSLRILKKSLINGKEFELNYGFKTFEQ